MLLAGRPLTSLLLYVVGIRKKGRRKIVVDGCVYYWDYREKGSNPGYVSDAVWFGVPTFVRIVSEDKMFHATYDGVHLITPKGQEVRPHHVFPVTPRGVQCLIKAAHRMMSNADDE